MSDLPDRIKYQNAQAESKPIDIVKEALESRGVPSSEVIKPSYDMPEDFFVHSCENYCQEAVDAIRSNSVNSLRKLFADGTNLQCANKFGESLIHLACRRSHRDVVSFLVNEAGVSLRVRDDYGRTPFHDACWRSELDLELIDMLLEREPKLLMLCDKRGHTPLDYTRRCQWAELVPFLQARSEKFVAV
jgi:ankyrin repeat protein